MKSTKQILGQFMTPESIATLLAENILGATSGVIDLAAGDCSLLRAISDRRPKIGVYGCEIDSNMRRTGMSYLPKASLVLGDGLNTEVSIKKQHKKHLTVVGNPPFTEMHPSPELRKLTTEAFPGLTTKLGHKRSELYFLARSLLLAKKHEGLVVILMPIGFADGDIYRQYRKLLMENYAVRKVIEISASTFGQTEARTVLLVIDTKVSQTKKIEISQFDAIRNQVDLVYKGTLIPGERLDARYHVGKALGAATVEKLEDLGATVVRGRVTHKESKSLSLNVVHTTDLAKAVRGKLVLKVQSRKSAADHAYYSEIVAEAGDILLSRTGSRVSWEPILVSSGSTPITDHVFRIRVPKSAKQRVTQAFQHPAFSAWLASISKGVCAAVVTKRELLAMPIFE